MYQGRAGRKSKGVPGFPLIVEDLDMEGKLIKTYSKTGTVPNGYYQIRNGEKVKITKEEYEQIVAENFVEKV
jgi:hypothetical protein